MEAALRNNNHENEANGGGGEMRIDIPAEGGAILDHRRQARRRRSSRKIIEMTLALGGQAIGAVVAVALTSRASSWAMQSVELCILLGLCSIFAALALRRDKPELAAAVAKMGAVATALAIVIALTSNLPQFVALAAGGVAFVIIAVAVAFTSSN